MDRKTESVVVLKMYLADRNNLTVTDRRKILREKKKEENFERYRDKMIN